VQELDENKNEMISHKLKAQKKGKKFKCEGKWRRKNTAEGCQGGSVG